MRMMVPDMDSQTNDYALLTKGDVFIVRLRLENLLNIIDVNRLGAQLDGIVDNGARKLVLDLKNTTFIGSAALGMLLALSQRLRSLDGRMILSHPEHIEPLLKVSRTERLFELAPDPRAALNRLR